MSETIDICSSFIEGAPPGELHEVINDIKTLTSDDADLIQKLNPAFQSYNEEQLVTVKLPGASQPVRPALPPSQSSSNNCTGPDILPQPTFPHHLLRPPHLHIVHIRPHHPEAQQLPILHPRLPTL